MRAIEILQQYWEQFKRLLVFAQYCTENQIQTPVCRNFWMWTIYISLSLGLLIAILLGKRIYKEQLELHRNRKRLEARQIVADEETMDEARWKGEEMADVELSQDELAQRMREAIKMRAESAEASLKKDAATR